MEVGSITGEDLIQLQEEIAKNKGFDKIRPVLSFQQHFFGLFGTAVFLRSQNGSLNTIAFTNIPNCETDESDFSESEESDFDETEEFDFDETEEDEAMDASDFFDSLDEIDFGENSAEEFKIITESMMRRLAPCFEIEKIPRFFSNTSELEEFISPEMAAPFQGYKLLVIPIRRMRTYKKAENKKADAIVICYTYDDSEYLFEHHAENIESIWKMYYFYACGGK